MPPVLFIITMVTYPLLPPVSIHPSEQRVVTFDPRTHREPVVAVHADEVLARPERPALGRQRRQAIEDGCWCILCVYGGAWMGF